ncbi:MAG: hypothetical protein ACFFAS_17420 [Promethearchaeota archaeon]
MRVQLLKGKRLIEQAGHFLSINSRIVRNMNDDPFFLALSS